MTRVLFRASDSTHGTELWVTDGMAAGTSFIADIDPGTASSNPTGFTAVGTKVVFIANDGTHGSELWSTNGTASGTVLVDDIYPGSKTSSIYDLTAFGSKAIFRANDGTHGAEIWVTDGTTAGTTLLKDIIPGAGGAYESNFTAFKGEILFNAKAADGFDIWETDGTAAGTVEIKTVYPNANISGSAPFTVAGGLAFFPAKDGSSAHGTELWVTDGTAAGTTLVKDINPGTASSSPTNITALGNKVVFAANDGTDGNELWISDGTTAGTSLLKDVNPGSASSNPKYLTVRGNHVLFFANYSGRTSQLWTTDGTTAGTSFVANVTSAGAMTALGNEVLFEGNDGIHGTELWVSDGTAAGTGELADLNPGSTGSYPGSFTVTGNTALFSALYGSQFDLWSTDGTAAGTAIVSTAPSSPSTFFAAPALACFAAGTLIMTPDGLIPVEQIAVGGMVTIFGGGQAAPVKWVGRSTVDPARHPRPWDVHPVRILAGAFGKTMPQRDLRLSPEHAVFTDGVLIPIRHLVNDTTIVQEEGGAITYWHVELDTHAAIFAEGLPVETYRDTGSRDAFDDAPVRALYAGFAARTTAGSFAPMIETGPVIARVRARLAARARRRRVAAPGTLRLRIGAAGTVQATLPAGIGRIHLVSPSRHPDGDQRRLGAAVCGVTLDGQALPLDGGCMTAGFHGMETGAGSWRWTDGRGVMLIPASGKPRAVTIEIANVMAKAA